MITTSGERAAKSVFEKLYLACDHFLSGISLDFIGFLPQDALAAALGVKNDWREKPLYVAGRCGGDGDFVACLAHGRHRDLYHRALQGTAAVFGHDVAWLDVDEIRRSVMSRHFTVYLALTLANMYPELLARWLKHPLETFGSLVICWQQEGKS